MRQSLIDKLDYKYTMLIPFYFEIKEIIITAEREDKGQRLSAPAITEFRNALDHIMRYHQVRYNLKNNKETIKETGYNAHEYCKLQLSKTRAHLYRAGYDAYDSVAISIAEDIDKILGEVTYGSLIQVFDDIEQEIYLPYWSAKELITTAKLSKNIESPEDNMKYFKQYEEAVYNLQLIRVKLIKCLKDFKSIDLIVEIESIISTAGSTLIMNAIPGASEKIFQPFDNSKQIINTFLKTKYYKTDELKKEAEDLLLDAFKKLSDIKKILDDNSIGLERLSFESRKKRFKDNIIRFLFFIGGAAVTILAAIIFK